MWTNFCSMIIRQGLRQRKPWRTLTLIQSVQSVKKEQKAIRCNKEMPLQQIPGRCWFMDTVHVDLCVCWILPLPHLQGLRVSICNAAEGIRSKSVEHAFILFRTS